MKEKFKKMWKYVDFFFSGVFLLIFYGFVIFFLGQAVHFYFDGRIIEAGLCAIISIPFILIVQAEFFKSEMKSQLKLIAAVIHNK